VPKELNPKGAYLLLSQVKSLDLGMGENSHDLAVLLDSLKLSRDSIWSLSGSSLVFLGVMLEGSLLGLVPVTIESTLHLFTKMLSPNGGSKRIRGLLSLTRIEDHGESRRIQQHRQ
jgi:hypothetical protein